MIGHDIIYNHPMNCCACLGRAAERDFLTFADSVCQLEGGVYISIGSAVMSPMVFEKSMSMAQNLAMQRGTGGSRIITCWSLIWLHRIGTGHRASRRKRTLPTTFGTISRSAGWAARCGTCRLTTGISC